MKSNQLIKLESLRKRIVDHIASVRGPFTVESGVLNNYRTIESVGIMEHLEGLRISSTLNTEKLMIDYLATGQLSIYITDNAFIIKRYITYKYLDFENSCRIPSHDMTRKNFLGSNELMAKQEIYQDVERFIRLHMKIHNK